MKLIIDIEPRYCEDMQSDVKELYYEAINRITEAVRNGIPYEDKPQGDFISREALKEEGYEMYGKGYLQGYERGKNERPQEWIRREDVIHLLERWSDGYSYIEIPTDDALKAIKEMEGGTHGQ